jgi:aspartate/methionine/tyrosine aminotransferase
MHSHRNFSWSATQFASEQAPPIFCTTLSYPWSGRATNCSRWNRLTPSTPTPLGSQVRTIVLDPEMGFLADSDRILEGLSSSPRLLVICNPNNPTGAVIPRNDLLRIVAAAAPDTMVLVDEAYIDFCPQDSVFGFVRDHPNLAVVRTFSKAYALAGLRVGFAP